MNKSVLEVKKVKKNFMQGSKTLRVLKGISATFEQGKTYAITGASGSGKSTLLHLLGGLDTPTDGTVLFNDNPVAITPAIGFVFQFHYLINELTVLENIILMGLIQGKERGECERKAKKLLKHVGLTSKAKSHPFDLSGGEQQRISILRATFNNPDFLLADEPTGSLDADNAAHIVDFLLQCKEEWGMGVILCSHDKAVYQRMGAVLGLEAGVLAG